MYEHQRHKPPRELTRPRELLVVCAPLRSNVNLSRIARAASCCGLERIICTGPAKLERRIARDGADTIQIESHRTLPPVLDQLRMQIAQFDKHKRAGTATPAWREIPSTTQHRAGAPVAPGSSVTRIVSDRRPGFFVSRRSRP